VQPPAFRHPVHPRPRPCRAHGVGGAHVLSGPARDHAAPARALVLEPRPEVVRPLHLHVLALAHRHRDPSGRGHRRPRVLRPCHGRGGGRDRRDRRRLHDLPGRDAGRHLAVQGRKAPSHAGPQRGRERGREGAGRLRRRRRRQDRQQCRGDQAGTRGRHGRRHPGADHPVEGRDQRRRDQHQVLGLWHHARGRSAVAGDEGLDRQRVVAGAPDRAALAGHREALGPPRRGLRARRSRPQGKLRGRQADAAGREV
ncbi:MAG: Serine acetyltransferase, partial [uncultured Ramlibacter sp.]